MTAADRYYAVHVSNTGRASLAWSVPFGSGPEAKAAALARLAEGKATMAFVVRVGADGGREVRSIYPRTVRKIIGHYADLLAALEER